MTVVPYLFTAFPPDLFRSEHLLFLCTILIFATLSFYGKEFSENCQDFAPVLLLKEIKKPLELLGQGFVT